MLSVILNNVQERVSTASEKRKGTDGAYERLENCVTMLQIKKVKFVQLSSIRV